MKDILQLMQPLLEVVAQEPLLAVILVITLLLLLLLIQSGGQMGSGIQFNGDVNIQVGGRKPKRKK